MLRMLFALAMAFHHPPPDFGSNLQYWQHKLNLSDWSVSLVIVSSGELDSNTVGDIEPSIDSKTAILRILREQDYDLPRRLARADQQLTIVHELVHLKRRVTLGEAYWRDERATVQETTELVVTNRRWREMAAIEGL